MKDPLEKRLVATLVVILLVLVAMTITAVRTLHRSVASTDWVNHSHALILEADAILSSLNAAETSLRDHLLTGEARDQALYRQRLSDVLEHLEVTRALARSQSAAFKEVAALESVIRRKLDLDRGAIQARSRDGVEAARKALYAEDQATLMRQVQRHVDGIKDEQKTLLQERDRAVYRHTQNTSWALCGGFALNFLLLGFGFWLVRDDLTVRRRAAEAMRQANEQLEARVNERAQELGKAVAALSEENLERRWKNEALELEIQRLSGPRPGPGRGSRDCGPTGRR
jgi:CHASE3 domain sensor protein